MLVLSIKYLKQALVSVIYCSEAIHKYMLTFHQNKQCCNQGSRCRDRDQDRGSRVRDRGQDRDISFRDRGQGRGSIPQDRDRGTRQLAYIINSAVFGGGSSQKF